MITTTVTKTTHKTEDTIPKCDTCGALATHATADNYEIPSTDPEGWREFKLMEKFRNGCAKHPVVSRTKYLDGRVRLTENCVPEKSEWALNDQIS